MLNRTASHFPFPENMHCKGVLSCETTTQKIPFFEPMNKRRRGFPSETNVKRRTRIVHGDKLLEEKLGRNDPCHAVVTNALNAVAFRQDAFDGSNREEYF